MGSLANILAVAAVLAALVVGGSCGSPQGATGPQHHGQLQRRRVRDQGRQQVALQRHDGMRQRPHLQGRQGLRLLLRGQVQGAGVLRQPGDGVHHRHELRAHRTLPFRPQRQGLWVPRQARTQRQAPPLRHHRHGVQEGAVQVRGRDEDRVPRGEVVQPKLPGAAGEVRLRRRRHRADGAQGQGVARVEADEALLGRNLEDGHAQGAQGPLLHPPHQ
ncbi:hypothetical protein HU200_035346 [Digitaria exilis]|uniref:Uncharacterized protein n=1 Tax=Digitaria exilis TaxID=1010633 RepID=A0A835BHA3_9POAL|nr:hypothetical protein HU200_035346 [Digitaria exilis]